jgi:Rps23 Pro-64 3,4-dihydroxylase Tpa1-like proline 4-hydroxylase
MKLIYQIPDKLYYIQHFLSYPAYKKLHYDVFKSKLLDLTTVKNCWQPSLLKNYDNSPDRTILDSNYPILKTFETLLNFNPFIKIKQKPIKFILHSMKNGSGINWHDDGSHEYGITYYINRRWNMQFGGEFLFKDLNSNGFIPLVGNSLLIVKAPLQHKVTPVMNPIVPRKTIQIFIPKA